MVKRLMLVASVLVACDSKPAAPGTQPGSSAAPTASAAPAAPAAPAAEPGSPAPAAADPGFGDVAFKTYSSGKSRVVFTTDSKAKVTWGNMRGPAATGTYVKTGKEIVVTWDPEATNYGSQSEKFRQMGPCSMARYERVDRKGALHDDSPMIYQQSKPRCDTVRMTK